MREKRTVILSMIALWVLAFTLAVLLEPAYQNREGTQSRSGNLLALTLGEGRRVFANHFFEKADVYFHSGFYPSIFDNQEAFQTAHIAEDTGAVRGSNQGEDHDFMGKPRDWIDAFGRSFQPNRHVHVGHDQDDPETSNSDGHVEGEAGEAKEILPWLRLSTTLDPGNEQTYIVTAFWLQRELNQPEAAEKVLREGIRHNPRSSALLAELGRIYAADPASLERARNLLDLAARYWDEVHSGSKEPDLFLYGRIHMLLADVNHQLGDLTQTLNHLERVKTVSPHPEAIQMRIDELNLPGTPADKANAEKAR